MLDYKDIIILEQFINKFGDQFVFLKQNFGQFWGKGHKISIGKNMVRIGLGPIGSEITEFFNVTLQELKMLLMTYHRFSSA